MVETQKLNRLREGHCFHYDTIKKKDNGALINGISFKTE